MNKYTVLGVYDDGLSFAEHIEAIDAHTAISIVAHQSTEPSSLQIIGAIEGWCMLTSACDDSGLAAYAIDLCQ